MIRADARLSSSVCLISAADVRSAPWTREPSSTTSSRSRSSAASLGSVRTPAGASSTGPSRRPDALAGRTVLVTGPDVRPRAGHGGDDGDARGAGRARRSGRLEARCAAGRADRNGTRRIGSRVVVADLGSLASVRAAVSAVLASEDRLDVVVDNAGAIFPDRHIGPDGIEATFALLVVGPFALEAGLQPLLRDTPGARVIAVTSGGMYTQALDLDDLRVQPHRLLGAARVRPGEARADGADARVGAPLGRGAASATPRCIRAGRTRPGSPPPCPGSTGRSVRSCGRLPTAPTRSSGSPPGRTRWRRPGASSWTGGRGPSTASRPRGSRPPTGGSSGTLVVSLAGVPDPAPDR